MLRFCANFEWKKEKDDFEIENQIVMTGMNIVADYIGYTTKDF